MCYIPHRSFQAVGGNMCSRVARWFKRIIQQPEAFHFNCIMFTLVKVSLQESLHLHLHWCYRSRWPLTSDLSAERSEGCGKKQACDFVACELAAASLQGHFSAD